MAIMWMDNFSLYGTDLTLLVNGLYAETGATGVVPPLNELVDDPDPNDSGIVFKFGRGQNTSGSTAAALRRVFTSTLTTVGVGQRIWFDTLPSVASNHASIIASFRDPANVTLFNVEVGTAGQLICWRGSVGGSELLRTTVIAQTTGPVIVANAWQHVEIRASFSATVGTIEIRVEGVPVLDVENIITDPDTAGCAQWQASNFTVNLGGAVAAPTWYLKDIISWNTSGSYNNDFLGSVGIYTLFPNADDALNWTPVGAANGWSILDNVPPDDGSYIEADITPPAAYVASLTNLPPDLISIRGVQSVLRARKADGGDGNIQVGFISGASTALGADRPMTAAFTYWVDISEENPDTASAYTPSAVDALKLSVDRTV